MQQAQKEGADRESVTAVLFVLESEVRPDVIETLSVAERIRRKLMGIHKRVVGDPSKVSAKFSGKDLQGQRLFGHRHAFILPLDRDQDGRLDHLLVVCKEPFDLCERRTLGHLESVWQPDGYPDLRCTPILWGGPLDVWPRARILRSATPFVPPRHYRKGRGELGSWLVAELRREAGYQSLPPLVRISRLPCLQVGARELPWIQFRRDRKDESARLGYGFELQFTEPPIGPVALGYACHFGLGLFVPVDPIELR